MVQMIAHITQEGVMKAVISVDYDGTIFPTGKTGVNLQG